MRLCIRCRVVNALRHQMPSNKMRLLCFITSRCSQPSEMQQQCHCENTVDPFDVCETLVAFSQHPVCICMSVCLSVSPYAPSVGHFACLSVGLFVWMFLHTFGTMLYFIENNIGNNRSLLSRCTLPVYASYAQASTASRRFFEGHERAIVDVSIQAHMSEKTF